jgi:type I restriction enzyme S subunit
MKMPRLGTDDARNSVFPLPPLAEQSRIVARVEELMGLCDALEAKGQLEAAQHAQLVQTLLGALTASTSPEELADNWQRVATHFDLLLDRPEAIDALEQTILQLAVRGLLVPQDPTDEPASELLKKIRAEKDRLIAEGKIKRNKPSTSIVEDVPFEAPQGWTWTTLSEICALITDGTHQTPTYTETGRPFLSAKNVKPFRFMPDPHRFVSDADFHTLRNGRIPNKGDILMTRVGAMIGEAAVIDQEIDFAFYVSLALLGMPGSLVSSHFLATWLNSPFGTANSVEKTLGRGVSAGNLNLTFIRSFAVPLPPAAEQHRIVARVASLRRLCADLRQRLAARQTTQAHLAEALIAEVA